MIDVVILRNSSENVRGIMLNGHANMGTKGEDIVCSAVSILVQVPTMYIVNEGLEEYIDYKIEHGNFKLAPSKKFSELTEIYQLKIKASMDIIATGLELLTKQYPEAIKIFDTIDV